MAKLMNACQKMSETTPKASNTPNLSLAEMAMFRPQRIMKK